MTTVIEQIRAADEAIVRNIEVLRDQRDLLSQNVISQLRNLVEGVAVRVHTGSDDAPYGYDAIEAGVSNMRAQGQLSFLRRFHDLLQKSASHYTLDGQAAERLMLKYYEYLLRVRQFLQNHLGITALQNLESFPLDLDPQLREYHAKIAEVVDKIDVFGDPNAKSDRYYIHKVRPFFVKGRIYYEVTFYKAVNKVSKFDRIIGFTSIDMTDKYAASLKIENASIDVLGRTMPISVIHEWSVSIRPCEFDNFARLLGHDFKTRTNSSEYRFLMGRLTERAESLLDLMDLSDSDYAELRARGTSKSKSPQLFPMLDATRAIIRAKRPGQNVLRYLLLSMNNQILKSQHYWEACGRLSDLYLSYGCIPFDTMPLCTSLARHNPRYWDLVESIGTNGREHELLARRVKNNVERHGILYTPVSDLGDLAEVQKLIQRHNAKLYYKHTGRHIDFEKGHVFVRQYEDETADIVEKLQGLAGSGVQGYEAAVELWMDQTSHVIDDEGKRAALKNLFSQSRVALIYGAAGTGKSTMVDHIANYFNDKDKLFLAHTNPAVDNLERKVNAQHSTFRTITRQIYSASLQEYDLLVIDESSTVSNSDLLKVLKETNFKLLVLVGDVFQIESIQFGNWFTIMRRFLPDSAVFELTTPFRTTNTDLLRFWDSVRNVGDDIAELMAKNRYSSALDESLFERRSEDEIVLCLNYDGLYGINNVNRFLQSSNPGHAVTWGVATYKVGDPVLFNESERFRKLIYNNLKGRIAGIEMVPGTITFDIELDRPVTEFDVDGDELEYVEGSIVRFRVYDIDVSDEDDDSLNTTVPFQVAYAVSIHKAQGLEYDSVKIVVTDANEDDITHSIFYTAVTRAREHLKIFWSPETQQAVIKNLSRRSNPRDVGLLCARRNLTTV